MSDKFPPPPLSMEYSLDHLHQAIARATQEVVDYAEAVKVARESSLRELSDHWLTKKEAAHYCRMSEATFDLHFAKAKGKTLRYHRADTKIRFKSAWLDSWMETLHRERTVYDVRQPKRRIARLNKFPAPATLSGEQS